MTWLDASNDDDVEYATPEEARAAELTARVETRKTGSETNPWIVALGVVIGIGFGLGLILFVIGNLHARSFSLAGGGTDSGLGEVVWGGALMGLGLSALFPLLAAQAVIWHLRRAAAK
ncbi:MAG: LPXTG cell wall anchor domain-containing protein [Pseudolysinimonas sp.]